ncbi:MAG TPA: hemolysin III family protein [Oscillospiraceae bacterium]|nr:hemolysin III family protein [Oscillospiraceae bacterium]HXK78365.1 hemolysin III family protein [Oscillospiraceae bacterium]
MFKIYTDTAANLPDELIANYVQAIDHCVIYLLIAGSYTPILLSAIRPEHPVLAWSIFGAEWGLAALAVTLTAIDLKKFALFSMTCYLAMGWLIVMAVRPAAEALSRPGMLLLLWGGIAYTLGAVLYGLGKKKKYLHAVFHVFVDIGCVLHAVCILRYVL